MAGNGVDGGERMDISTEVVLADAAAWIARLQRSGRTRATEAAFHEWLKEPAHAQAFARVADLWEIIPGAAQLLQTRARARRVRLAGRFLAAAGIAAVIAVGATMYLARGPEYRTAIGQQQVVTLADETRVALNTDSRLTVRYSARERRVMLDRGEALFEVTKNSRRAFIVQAGDTEVRAVGTKFDVRRSDGRVIVVLLEGKVEITSEPQLLSKPVPVATLSPGQRLTFGTNDGVAAVDRPNVDAATAWRRGDVMFEDATLSQAVAEMNRYAQIHVMLGDSELEGLRVSGVFESQSAVEFAEAVAALHHLQIERQGNALILTAPKTRQ
jgi:transmembrane sensor